MQGENFQFWAKVFRCCTLLAIGHHLKLFHCSTVHAALLREAKQPEARTVQTGPRSSNSRSNSKIKHIKHSTDRQAPCPELPEVIILRILVCVPLKQRLAVCTRVSKAWKAAATSATKDVSLQMYPKDGASLDSWLVAHGHQLTSLQLAQSGSWYEHTTYCSLLSLPCASFSCLQILTVEGYQFQLCSTATRRTRSAPPAAPPPSAAVAPHLGPYLC
jgi:hypothetical protein